MKSMIVLVLPALALPALPAWGWDIRYNVVPLESQRAPWVAFTRATDISDSGWVTGWSYNGPQAPSGVYLTPFLYHPTTGMADLGSYAGLPASGHGVNDAGQISGTAQANDDRDIAFRYTPGVGYESLGSLPGSSAAAGARINARGQVAGINEFPDGRWLGFRYTDGVGLQDLGHLGGNDTTAIGINDSGWVAGSSTFPDGGSHAFLWKDGVGMIDLGVGIGTALNNLGVVGGRSYDGQPMIFREGQAPVTVAGPPGMYYVSDINDQNVLVGGITFNNGIMRAYLATEADGVVLLNDLIPPDSGWDLIYGLGINNHGQIVGEGYRQGYGAMAYRLDPVPPPTLRIELQGTNVVISWAPHWSRPVLEAAEVMEPTAWRAVPGGDTSPVVLPARDAARFFRLNSQPTYPPRLSLQPAGPHLVVSWTPVEPGYVLESSPSLSAPVWTPVPGGTNSPVTVPNAAASGFFRLRK